MFYRLTLCIIIDNGSIITKNEADLSGIAGEKGDLIISDVLQKTYIDVEEGGVEAAAATYVVPGSAFISPEPKEFIADHPFIFYIKEVLKKNELNILMSPYPTDSILSFAQSGRKGETAQEIQNSLHLPDDNDKIESAVKESLSVLKRNDKYTLHTTTK
ncbi:Serpin domain containing protein, partial [Asbolus verrucosus]